MQSTTKQKFTRPLEWLLVTSVNVKTTVYKTFNDFMFLLF